LRQIESGEEFRVKILRGKPEQRATIALENDTKIRRAHRVYRPPHAIGSVIIGRNGERPRPQFLVIIAQNLRRRHRGRTNVETLVHISTDT
jgi:hypothetical protein